MKSRAAVCPRARELCLRRSRPRFRCRLRDGDDGAGEPGSAERGGSDALAAEDGDAGIPTGAGVTMDA